MSPIPVTSGSAKNIKKESSIARLLGSGRLSINQSTLPPNSSLIDPNHIALNVGSAGVAELAVFHPVCPTPHHTDYKDPKLINHARSTPSQSD